MKKVWQTLLQAGVLTLALILVPSSLWAASYTDTQGHWAVLGIEKANSLNLVKGYEDGAFRPDADVTRAEYIAFLNRSYGVHNMTPSQAATGYRDVADQAWYKSEIEAAQGLGYLALFDADKLLPDQAITREEVAQLTSSLLAIKEEAVQDQGPIKFSDAGDISPACRPGVADLQARGYLGGYPDGSFRPKAPVTRAEAISILLRGLKEDPVIAQANRTLVKSQDGKAYLIDQDNQARFKAIQTKDNRVKVNDKAYLLNDDDSLALGWAKRDGLNYYATADQGLARGWQQIDGQTYYFSPYSYERLEDGVFSTGYKAHWFNKDGGVSSGNRPGGHKGKAIYWALPDQEDLSNSWLTAPDAGRRFLGQAVANYAAKREGLPFKWYGCDLNDPSGVYCCGAVYSAYKELGIATLPPSASNIQADKGYRMVKDQYLTAPNYGGKYIPSSFAGMWPGDVSYSYYPGYNYGYNHAAIFLGFNNGRPIVAHATLADGFIVEPANIITNTWGYVYRNGVRFI